VVDLPEFVGPVTRISPDRAVSMFFSTWGMPSCSSVGTSLGMMRKAAARPGYFLYTLMRKRAMPGSV